MNLSSRVILPGILRQVRLLLSLKFLLFPLTLPASQQDTTGVAEKPAAMAGADQLANVTFGLLIVLGLIFALAWLFRRYGNLPTFNRSNIQIVGGVSLGPREKAILLEVEGERVLVGVASGQVTRLHVFSQRENATGQVAESEPNTADAQDDAAFARTLQQETAKSSEAGT